MTSPKLRLALAAGVFVAWIGYLTFLVATTRHPVILSRPQFLTAQLYVTARLTGDADKPAANITVEETLWAANEKHNLPRGTELQVNLDDVGPEQGWDGEGVYVLPLRATALPGTYFLPPVPRSPGFGGGKARIYPATADALQQVRDLIVEWKK